MTALLVSKKGTEFTNPLDFLDQILRQRARERLAAKLDGGQNLEPASLSEQKPGKENALGACRFASYGNPTNSKYGIFYGTRVSGQRKIMLCQI